MDSESDLFRSLQGEVSEEQWETFLQLQKQSGNLVCHDDDEEEDEDDNESVSSDGEMEIDLMKSIDESTSSQLESLQVSEKEPNKFSTEQEEELMKREQELTNKYINGELTFTQFTLLVENNEKKLEEETSKQEDADAFSLEMEFEKERKQMRRRRRRGQLPRDLEGLMGEANLKFARGEREQAITMCLELIRSAPRASEPYQTLGLLYEAADDMEKSLQFSLIAAFLSPNDPDEWVKLAELSLELGDTRTAVTCYSNALKYDPENISVHWERCALYEQLNEKRKALEGYQQIIKIMKEEQGQQCLQLAREVAKNYHEMGDSKQAINVMLTVFEKYPNMLTSEDVNVLLELQLSQNLYIEVIKILLKHCGLTFNTEISEDAIDEMIKQATECAVPEGLPIDLRIKLVVALIHLEGKHLVEELFSPLLQEDLEDVGDLYLDVAEAYMQKGLYSKALPLLATLVKTKNYNLAAIWLRYAECLSALGSIEKATEAYQKVVALAPSHMEARMSLSSLLQQLGRTDEALHAVTEADTSGNQQNVQLLFQRCTLLYSQGKSEEFVSVSKTLLSFCIPDVTSPEETFAILNNLSHRRRLEAFRDVLKEKGLEAWVPTITDKDIPLDDLWSLYLKVCNTLFKLKYYSELQELTVNALVSPLLTKDQTKDKEAECLCFLACYFNRNARYAYNFVKEMVVKNINNNRTWNFFCLIISMGQDLRHNKFCLRLTFKHPDHIPLGILNGHNAMVAGSYKHALGEYIPVFKSMPKDPFLSLMIGLTFLHMACQKFASKRHTLVVQAFAFLNQYMEFRGKCQETYYNIGRALHQLGICYMAVHYYKRALGFPPAVNDTTGDVFDLKREIAFNLALIYQNSGSENLAAMYISKYCIV